MTNFLKTETNAVGSDSNLNGQKVIYFEMTTVHLLGVRK
jgi:hypothetical protein